MLSIIMRLSRAEAYVNIEFCRVASLRVLCHAARRLYARRSRVDATLFERNPCEKRRVRFTLRAYSLLLLVSTGRCCASAAARQPMPYATRMRAFLRYGRARCLPPQLASSRRLMAMSAATPFCFDAAAITILRA